MVVDDHLAGARAFQEGWNSIGCSSTGHREVYDGLRLHVADRKYLNPARIANGGT